MQQGTILDVLKRKMRQTKEEMEKYKDECEEYHKRLQVEIMRREEVRKRALKLCCEFCELLVSMCTCVGFILGQNMRVISSLVLSTYSE